MGCSRRIHRTLNRRPRHGPGPCRLLSPCRLPAAPTRPACAPSKARAAS